MATRLTRHNGRAGKNGVYKANHNDRRFDLENAEHIDRKMTRSNIYWDCYSGLTTEAQRRNPSEDVVSFSDGELNFYRKQYKGYILAQHERNAAARHPERDRLAEDILADKRYCPEESIYQLGTKEEHADTETFLLVVNEFFHEMERRFGSNIHVLNWALHVDEGTPHIHERHVFDYENRYGEIQPGQDKALEALGFERPEPDKKQGKFNNRKMVFDAACRTMLFDICREHGLHIEEEPSYGGRAYLEKQDYILMKQKERLVEQSESLRAVTEKLSDAEALLDEVAEVAYEKAAEIVTDTVRAETQRYDLEVLEKFREHAIANNRDNPKVTRIVNDVLNSLKKRLVASAKNITRKLSEVIHDSKVKHESKERIKTSTRKSVMELLAKSKEEAEAYNSSREKQEKKVKTEMDR